VESLTTRQPGAINLLRKHTAAAAMVAVLVSGCAGPRFEPTLVSSTPASDTQVLDLSYVDELNAHVAQMFAEIDGAGDEDEALDMATHKGRQANRYLSTAITAVASYDYEHNKSLLPIWKALTEFTEIQAGRAVTDSQQLQMFYADNPDASQELAQFIIDQFLAIGIFVNLTVTPVTPRFLLPLDSQRIWPGVNARFAFASRDHIRWRG